MLKTICRSLPPSSSPSPTHSGHPGCTEKGDTGRAEGHSCLCSEFPGRQCGPGEPRPHALAGTALSAVSRPARARHEAHPLQVGKLRDACATSPCWGLNSGIRSGLQDGCGRAGEGTAARLRGHPVWTLRGLGRSKHRNKPRGRLPPTPSPGQALRGRRWRHLHLHLHLRTAEAQDPRDPPRLDVRLLSYKLEQSWLTSSGDDEARPGDAWGPSLAQPRLHGPFGRRLCGRGCCAPAEQQAGDAAWLLGDPQRPVPP